MKQVSNNIRRINDKYVHYKTGQLCLQFIREILPCYGINLDPSANDPNTYIAYPEDLEYAVSSMPMKTRDYGQKENYFIPVEMLKRVKHPEKLTNLREVH